MASKSETQRVRDSTQPQQAICLGTFTYCDFGLGFLVEFCSRIRSLELRLHDVLESVGQPKKTKVKSLKLKVAVR